MITTKIDFKCKLCKSTNLYVMPLDIKTKSGDYIRSNSRFRLKCKKCGMEYLLTLTIKSLDRKKKKWSKD